MCVAFEGGVGQVEMLMRTNIFALVGGGLDPQFSPVKAVVWDDRVEGNVTLEFEAKTLVRRVALGRNHVVVVLAHMVRVYSFEKAPQLLAEYETWPNTEGLVALSPASSSNLLVFPGKTAGWIRQVDLGGDLSVATQFKAHEHDLAFLQLNGSGTVLATASSEGTLIRVWDTKTGHKLHELRRGSSKESITSIAFNYDSSQIAVSSLKGTIHVFSTDTESGSSSSSHPTTEHGGDPTDSGTAAASPNTRSFFSPLVGLLPKALTPSYFTSEWSIVQFRMGAPIATRLAFGPEPNVLYAVGMDGSYSKLRFDFEAAVVEREDYEHNYLALDSDL